MTDGLRERKKRERRAALIDAAQAIAGERGLPEVTVEAICARADVSPRTFFNYFGSKDEALLALDSFQPPPEAIETFVAGGPTGRLLDDIGALALAGLERVGEDRDRVRRALHLIHTHPALQAGHVRWMERRRAEGLALTRRRLGAEDPRADVVAALMPAVALVTAERMGRPGADPDTAAQIRATVAHLRDVLAP
ncbi:TetR/AcrR family transcriptional regulator [Georgenia faecalis]|uniref:TetR/AcrR family transcriptional regulator n=1 Tax=Georgenia faecalis TaxID=2483799 RepID=UPI000FDBAD36|nr:TetR/AcrR family transcriptional regulator [Georgenia faecalis]